MANYTTFHFRAKLSFTLPEAVATTLQNQCGHWALDKPVPAQPWTSGSPVGENPDSALYGTLGLNGVLPDATPDGFNWAGWHLHPHDFFTLPRAQAIPRGTNTDEASIAPDFRRYAHGGAQLVFTCEFKNYDQEIERFLDWIAPYVRARFGKRSRGRRLVWVGWMRPECAERAYNIFIAPGKWTAGDGESTRVFIR